MNKKLVVSLLILSIIVSFYGCGKEYKFNYIVNHQQLKNIIDDDFNFYRILNCSSYNVSFYTNKKIVKLENLNDNDVIIKRILIKSRKYDLIIYINNCPCYKSFDTITINNVDLIHIKYQKQVCYDNGNYFYIISYHNLDTLEKDLKKIL